MIHKAELTNFQSHANTVVEFSPFVNAICGDSDHGKSGLLRGIIWALTNKPTGLGNVSDWIRTEKGAIKANQRCAVKLTTPKGAVTRERTSGFNGYVVDGAKEPLAAIRDSVPDEISQFFNITELNIQQQHDPHFMVTMSPPEAARFMNRLVNLSAIDACVSKVEGKKRAADATVARLTSDLQAVEFQIPVMVWVESAEGLLPQLQAMRATLAALKARIPLTQESVRNWEELGKFVNSTRQQLGVIQQAAKDVQDVESRTRFTCRRINELANGLDEFQSSQSIRKQLDHIVVAGAKESAALSRLAPVFNSKAKHIDSGVSSLEAYNAARPLALRAILADECAIRVAELQALAGRTESIQKRLEGMTADLARWDALGLDRISVLTDIAYSAERVAAPLARMSRVITGSRASLDAVSAALVAHREAAQTIESANKGIAEATAKLPRVCPTCGQAWNHSHQEK